MRGKDKEVEFEFDDAKLQKICETEKHLVRKLGPQRAKKVQTRLTALRSVAVVSDLWPPYPGGWHVLGADRPEQVAADLDGPYRLVIRPTEPVPRDAHGGVDWDSVRTVSVVEITNYH